MTILEKEIWKDIPEFNGLYQASNLGRIKSLKRPYGLKEKILKLRLERSGYYRVCLTKQSIQKYYLVHRLIYEAFNGSIPEGLQVNHINEIKTDNRLENLNLMTCKENTNWGSRNERIAKKLSITLKNRKDLSKTVLQFDLNDNLLKEYASIRQAERETGFRHSSISACGKGKLKQAYGYKWKYKE